MTENKFKCVGYAANNSAFMAEQRRTEALAEEKKAREIRIARAKYDAHLREMKRKGRIHRAKRKAAKAAR